MYLAILHSFPKGQPFVCAQPGQTSLEGHSAQFAPQRDSFIIFSEARHKQWVRTRQKRLPIPCGQRLRPFSERTPRAAWRLVTWKTWFLRASPSSYLRRSLQYTRLSKENQQDSILLKRYDSRFDPMERKRRVPLCSMGLRAAFAAFLPAVCKTKGYASMKAHILVFAPCCRQPLEFDCHDPSFVKPALWASTRRVAL